MNEQKALRALQLFNAKADKLGETRFVEQIFTRPSRISIVPGQTDFGVSFFGPDSDAIDAFCFNIRFFIQNNERSSFHNMSKAYAFLLNQGIVDKLTVDAFESARARIQELKEHREYIPPVDGKTYTPWEIFDTILYGELAHTNEKKAAIYQRWKARPEVLIIMHLWFNRVLAELVRICDEVRPINERVIALLAATS